MHDDFKTKLGTTLKDRQSKMLAMAQELCAVQKLDHATWRRLLSRAVAKKLGAPSDFSRYLYQLMNNLESVELANIRVACIGQEAEALHYGSGQGLFVAIERSRCRQRKEKENIETDEDRASRIQKSIETAIEGLSPSDRTPEALAKVLDWNTSKVRSYLFQKPEMAQKLGSK